MNDISVRTFDTTANGLRFSLVEKTVWYEAGGGTWSSNGSIETLYIGNGTSGALRFKSGVTGEMFLVAVGVHNNQQWCHVCVNLTGDQTAMKIHPEYHTTGSTMDNVLMNPQTTISATNHMGTTVAVNYINDTANMMGGRSWVVNIIIS